MVAEADFEETVVDLPAVEQLDKDYFAYGQQVIEDRAVPSAADGLKPVHRRILWDMHVQRLFPDRPFVKTARVVGDTMALFHPHGDQSIADALTRLAQPFANLVPLLDFHGNYGSPDFSAAAARYTETRLGFAGVLLLDDIDQRTVPMVENYEGSTEEPVVLPGRVPAPAGERRERHRRRPVVVPAAARPTRGVRRRAAPHRQPEGHRRRADGVPARARRSRRSAPSPTATR